MENRESGSFQGNGLLLAGKWFQGADQPALARCNVKSFGKRM